MSGNSDLLKPGTIIKPKITSEAAIILIEKLYGLTVTKISDLNAYDDRNFLVKTEKAPKNQHIPEYCEDGYVFKVLNSIDSKNTDFIEGQTEMSLHLKNNGISCPTPLKNISGQYYSIENCGDEKNLVRLFEFIPGKIFYEVTPTPELFFQTGQYAAQVELILKDFYHEGIKNRKTIWFLESVPRLTEFLYVCKEEDKVIVNQIIDQFQKCVLDKYETFEKSTIHGDLNEQNILVSKHKDDTKYSVTGILDFGDSQYSCVLYDLAISLTYMLLDSGDIHCGGYFLAGYEKLRNVPEQEKEVLKVCICARLCQSLVLGLYSYQNDVGNEYLLSTQKNGWKLLKELWNKDNNELIKCWYEAVKNYSPH